MTVSVSQELIAVVDDMANPANFVDCASTIQYANAPAAQLFGYAHHLDMIGTTYADWRCKAAEFADTFIQQDQHVITTGEMLRTLDIHPYADGQWAIYIVSRQRWLADDGTVLGCMAYGLDITETHSIALAAQLANWPGDTGEHFTLTEQRDQRLSSREMEILFLIVRGKTAKLVAAALGLSYRTVQQYIEILKAKFNVSSKVELIEAAMMRGYLNQIPVTLFNRQLSVVLGST